MLMRSSWGPLLMLLCTASGFAVADEAPRAAPAPSFDVANASQQAGHPVVLWVTSKEWDGAAATQADQFAAKWPDRTIMVVNIYHLDATVAIRPAVEVKDRFEASTLKRIEDEIVVAMRKERLNVAMARLVGEVGAIAAGKPPEVWDSQKHPIQALMGGQDVSEKDKTTNALINIMAGLVLLGLFLWWLRIFLGNPKEALLGLAVLVVEGSLSSLSGGRGGGGGMSGGGGGFDGGGATGSW